MDPDRAGDYSFMRVPLNALATHFRTNKRLIEKEIGFILHSIKKISNHANAISPG